MLAVRMSPNRRWRRNIATLYVIHDQVIEIRWQHSQQGHHAHHHGAPIPREAVVLGLGDGFIHAHVHKGILWKPWHLVCIRRDRRVMDMLESHLVGKSLHLAERARVFGVGSHHHAIAEQVAHRVHVVMWHMTVQHPLSWIFRYELEVARLPNSNPYGVCRYPRRLWLPSTFRAGHNERVAVQVNRMMVHAEVDESYAHATAQPHYERRGHGTTGTVKRQPIPLHIGCVWNGVGRQHCPFL